MVVDYDAIPPGYYDAIFERRRGAQSKWHHLKFKRFADAICGDVDHLDVACSAGTLFRTLDQRTRSVGVDIALPQIALACERHGSDGRRFVVGGADGLPFADRRFDVVTMVELVEHLSEAVTDAALREARRVLRPGGRLLLSTPNYASLWPLVERLVNRIGAIDYDAQHINRFDRKRLSATLAAAGFTAARVDAYQFAAPFCAALGWSTADAVARLEPGLLTRRFGLLLFAEAVRGDG